MTLREYMLWLSVLLYAAVLTATLISAALAHDGPDPVEKFYAGWLMPDTRMADGRRHNSCCNKMDCAPRATRLRNGTWQVAHKGRWLDIPENKLEHNYADERLAPDAQSHVCIREAPVPIVLCAVLGTGT